MILNGFCKNGQHLQDLPQARKSPSGRGVRGVGIRLGNPVTPQAARDTLQ